MKVISFNESTSITGGTDIVVKLERAALRKEGILVKEFNYSNKYFLDAGLLNKIKEYHNSCTGKLKLSRLNKMIEIFRPDIIHFHNIYQMFRSPVWNLINAGDARIIIHLHNYYPFCLNSLMYKKNINCSNCLESNSWIPGIIHTCCRNSFTCSFLMSINRLKPQEYLYALSKVSKVITVSRFQAEKLIKCGIPKNKIEILFNPVEVHSVNKVKGEYVLYLGILSHHKGIDLFCKAAQRLPSISFKAAGEGNEFLYLKKKYSSVKNLEFTGYVTGEEKEELLKRSRFLYYPSLTDETFGLSILEAYSYGKPVLTTGAGGTREIVSHGVTGYINDDFSIDSQVKSVAMLWNQLEQETAFPETCFNYAKKFSPGLHAQKLIDIYKEVCSNNKRGF